MLRAFAAIQPRAISHSSDGHKIELSLAEI
jgi:hypothetical protein